jgi:hypothetical protein
MTDGYGAVLVDRAVAQEQDEVAGAVITSGEGGTIASASDSRFVVLSHPLESSILASTGYSWTDLLRQGRYVAISNVICRECGTVFPRYRLAAPGGTGCITSLALGVAAGLSVGIWRHTFSAGFLAWYAVTFGTMMIAGSLASLYVRLRFSERAATLRAARSCPACHADNATGIMRGKSVACPVCRNQSLRFVIAGIS